MSLGLALVFLAMLALALALLLLPLRRRAAELPSRDAYNLAVYRDQLAELERDRARNLLREDQAAAARAEIGRRILALPARRDAPPPARRGALAVTIAVLLLPTAASLLYWRLGSPALSDQPLAARRAAGAAATAQSGAHRDIEAAVGRLAAHLKDHPQDLTGWLLLARSEASLGRYPAAAEAYRRAADLSGHRADIAADLGEALVLEAGGNIVPAARHEFELALRDPQNAPRARYYLALALMQHGDVAGAVAAWQALVVAAPADAPWLPLVRRQIAAASAGGGAGGAGSGADRGGDTGTVDSAAADPAIAAAAEAAAAASPEERRAMIDAMVAQLAARMAKSPDDAAGWTRLGRSYMVLGQPDKAREAYARAVALLPHDASLRQALDEATAASGAAAGAATPGKAADRPPPTER